MRKNHRRALAAILLAVMTAALCACAAAGNRGVDSAVIDTEDLERALSDPVMADEIHRSRPKRSARWSVRTP